MPNRVLAEDIWIPTPSGDSEHLLRPGIAIIRRLCMAVTTRGMAVKCMVTHVQYVASIQMMTTDARGMKL